MVLTRQVLDFMGNLPYPFKALLKDGTQLDIQISLVLDPNDEWHRTLLAYFDPTNTGDLQLFDYKIIHKKRMIGISCCIME